MSSPPAEEVHTEGIAVDRSPSDIATAAAMKTEQMIRKATLIGC